MQVVPWVMSKGIEDIVMWGKTRLKFSLCGMLFLLCSLFVGASVYAAQRELKTDTSDKVDAVLVLDASGSMLVTDPARLRDQGAKLFLQSLRPEDRVALVQFSREASIVRPLQLYSKEQSPEIERDLGKIENTGAYTDLLSGIKLAKSVLEASPRPDANQIIVLLSDGKMEPDPAVGSMSVLSGELLNGLLPDLKAKGIKIYTVAFSNQADKAQLAAIALGTDGVSWYSPDADTLHKAYADLFVAVKKPQMLPLTNKGFHIDESVQEATFYMSRSGKEEVEIESPSGTKINANSSQPDVRWFKGDKFDVVTISTPAVGDWQISGLTPEEGFATILTNLKLISDWPSSFNAETEMLLQARLYENDKPVALPEVNGVTRYGYQITPTDQVSTPVIRGFLSDDGKDGDKIAADGIFSAQITVDTVGEYRLRVVAQAPTFTRNQQLPFRVKAPLISLSVVSREVEDAGGATVIAGEGHGGGHGGGFAGGQEEEGAGDKTEESAAAHASASPNSAAKPAPASESWLGDGTKSQFFVIELSEDAAQLKSVEVKLIAVDEHRKRYNIPLRRVENHSARFEAAADYLPHQGKYELRAFLSGVGKSKKTVKGQSRIISFSKQRVEGEPEVRVVIAEREKPVDTGFSWMGLLCIILANLGAGACGVFYIQHAQKSMLRAAPEFEAISGITEVIADLEKRIDIEEVDLNDPLFTDPNYEIAATMSGVATAATSAVAAHVEAAPIVAEQSATPQPVAEEKKEE